MSFIDYLTDLYWAPTLCQAHVRIHPRNKWTQMVPCSFNLIKKANWISKCPLCSHICFRRTLRFYHPVSRWRFEFSPTTSPPRFFWESEEGEESEWTESEPSLITSFQTFVSLFQNIHNTWKIYHYADAAYWFSCVISHNLHENLHKVGVICIIIIVRIYITHLQMRKQTT